MKVAFEKKVVERMIRLYCRKKEHHRELCPDCAELLDYAMARLNHCPFGDQKKSCKQCPIHCYKPAMRNRIRQVMRFSGPRMLFYAPGMAIRYLLQGK